MMMVAAARKRLSIIQINLWQTGIRSYFRFAWSRLGCTQDETWAKLRPMIEARCPEVEEWELQLIRSIIYEEHNCTLEEGKHLVTRWPESTPLLDALGELLKEARSVT